MYATRDGRGMSAVVQGYEAILMSSIVDSEDSIYFFMYRSASVVQLVLSMHLLLAKAAAPSLSHSTSIHQALQLLK